MIRNMGTIDRAVRAFLVAPLAVLAGWLLGPLTISGIALFAFAAVMLATAAVGFCPLYVPFGIRTCAAPKV